MSKSRTNAETLRTVLVAGDVTNANFTGADLEVGKGGTGASSAGAARTALGVAIGSDVLAPDGSAANLTNLPAGGAEDFVASGTLPNGKPVILKANGQVEVVSGTAAIAQSIPLGSEAVFGSANSYYVSISYDPNNANRFVAVWLDAGNSNHGKAVVGTVSNASISYGTTVTFNAATTGAISNCAFDLKTANKIVITFQDDSNSGYGTAVVGTLNGASLSFGSKYVFESANINDPAVGFNPNTANQLVVAYGAGSSGYSRVGTVSGTSISFATRVTFNSLTQYISISFDINTANKFIICYRDRGNANYGKVIVGAISGTSLSYGNEVTFYPNNITQMVAAYDPSQANKVVIIYRNDFASDVGVALCGTVNGTTISYGTAVVFNNASTRSLNLDFQKTGSKFIITYADNGNSSYGTSITGTLSGTNVTFEAENVFNSGSVEYTSISFDENTLGKFVVAYRDTSNSNYATAILGQLAVPVVTNLTATNFLGTATAAYTNGQTASIMLQGGISDNQTSLAIGSTYFVQPTGLFATTSNANTVLAGKAVSATSLLLNGLDEIPSQTGNTGKFLTTDGSSPSWGTVAPAGMTLLSTVTANASSTVTLSGMDSTYDEYVIVISAARVSAASAIRARLTIGGSERSDDKYKYVFVNGTTGGTAANGRLSLSSTYISMHWANIDRTADFGSFSSTINIPAPSRTDTLKSIYFDNVVTNKDTASERNTGMGRWGDSSGIYLGALTAIKFYLPAGTITSGEFKLYGLRK